MSPPPLALTPGTVSLPHGPNLPRKGEERLSDERRAEIRRDLAKVLGPVVQVVGGAAQSDHAGHGVVAARPSTTSMSLAPMTSSVNSSWLRATQKSTTRSKSCRSDSITFCNSFGCISYCI